NGPQNGPQNGQQQQLQALLQALQLQQNGQQQQQLDPDVPMPDVGLSRFPNSMWAPLPPPQQPTELEGVRPAFIDEDCIWDIDRVKGYPVVKRIITALAVGTGFQLIVKSWGNNPLFPNCCILEAARASEHGDAKQRYDDRGGQLAQVHDPRLTRHLDFRLCRLLGVVHAKEGNLPSNFDDNGIFNGHNARARGSLTRLVVEWDNYPPQLYNSVAFQKVHGLGVNQAIQDYYYRSGQYIPIAPRQKPPIAEHTVRRYNFMARVPQPLSIPQFAQSMVQQPPQPSLLQAPQPQHQLQALLQALLQAPNGQQQNSQQQQQNQAPQQALLQALLQAPQPQQNNQQQQNQAPQQQLQALLQSLLPQQNNQQQNQALLQSLLPQQNNQQQQNQAPQQQLQALLQSLLPQQNNQQQNQALLQSLLPQQNNQQQQNQAPQQQLQALLQSLLPQQNNQQQNQALLRSLLPQQNNQQQQNQAPQQQLQALLQSLLPQQNGQQQNGQQQQQRIRTPPPAYTDRGMGSTLAADIISRSSTGVVIRNPLNGDPIFISSIPGAGASSQAPPPSQPQAGS
ncbi:hypothetical protein BDZ45DRAFT_699272, partial [Acephala macrosclerotiorum]